MKLLVGLGNPGAQYQGNRHNIGFMALDAIAREHSISQFRTKHSGFLAEGAIGGEKVILLKPQTFMNRSGDSVQQVAKFYKIEPADIIVFYDELDLTSRDWKSSGWSKRWATALSPTSTKPSSARLA